MRWVRQPLPLLLQGMLAYLRAPSTSPPNALKEDDSHAP